jgi:L-asparaginase
MKENAIQIQEIKHENKKIIVIFTGGTISMKIDENNGVVPALSDNEIISKIKGVEKIAHIEDVHFGSYPGPHMTPDLIMKLCKMTKEFVKREDVQGVVITHGTDCLEETAFVLDLTIDTDKPIVFTGAMRNSSELGYDGPANLSAAICTVLSKESKGKGTLVVMNNQVFAAEEVMKTHTLNLDTFKSADFGPLGIVDGDLVLYYRDRKKKMIIDSDKIEKKVALIKICVGMDSECIDYYVDKDYKGIVIEAMGRGNIPPNLVKSLDRALRNNIPVVLVSRCSTGRVLDSYGYEGGGRQLRDMGVILGDSLSGQKARIKLMVILGKTQDVDEIKYLFEQDLYRVL